MTTPPLTARIKPHRQLILVACVWLTMAAVVCIAYLRNPCPAPIYALPDKVAGAFVAKELFNDKIAVLRADGAGLRTNMLLQGVFIILGLFALRGRSKVFDLPVLQLKLPLKWVRYIIPLVLLFLWFQFGFALDDLINARSDAFRILKSAVTAPASEPAHDATATAKMVGDPAAASSQALLPPLPSFTAGSAAPRVRISATTDKNSWEHMIGGQMNDAGFLDAWFLSFRKGQHYIDEGQITPTRLFMCCVFGVLLGLTHALIVGLLIRANLARKQPPATVITVSRQGTTPDAPETRTGDATESVATQWMHRGANALPYILLGFLLVSHYQFYTGGQNPNWFQAAIALWAFLGTMLIIAFRDESRDEKPIDPTKQFSVRVRYEVANGTLAATATSAENEDN